MKRIFIRSDRLMGEINLKYLEVAACGTADKPGN